MGTPTNGSTDEPVTKVQYLTGDTSCPGGRPVGRPVDGCCLRRTHPDAGQLEDPTLLADNTVVVLLGDDKAGKTLAQMTGTDTSTTVAGETTMTGAP